jgi:hypothetical protein
MMNFPAIQHSTFLIRSLNVCNSSFFAPKNPLNVVINLCGQMDLTVNQTWVSENGSDHILDH